jgi:hypothetical protein
MAKAGRISLLSPCQRGQLQPVGKFSLNRRVRS